VLCFLGLLLIAVGSLASTNYLNSSGSVHDLSPATTPPYAIGVVTKLPTGANYPVDSEYPTGPLFVRMRVVNSGNSWSSPGLNAQQALAMITQTKPQVLERMTSGLINTKWDVPVCSGCSAMTYGQFLNQSMKDCQCYITPRIDINETWDSGTFLTDAQSILNTPVSPKFSILSIDDWETFCGKNNCSCALDKQIFQPLYAMGWKGVGVLNAGAPYYGTCGWATYVDFDISSNWAINLGYLSTIKDDLTVQKILLYAPDFPTEAQNLQGTCTSSSGNQFHGCDEIANVVTSAAEQQAKDGYTYAYPLEQTFWDVNQMYLSNGTSIYNVMLNLMNQYNRAPAQTTTQTSTAQSTTSSHTTTSSTSTQSGTQTSTRTLFSTTVLTRTESTTVTSYKTESYVTSIQGQNTSTTDTVVENTTLTYPVTLTVTSKLQRSVGTTGADVSTTQTAISDTAQSTAVSSSGSNSNNGSSNIGYSGALVTQLKVERVQKVATTMAFGTTSLVFLAGLFPLSYMLGKSKKVRHYARWKSQRYQRC
jgi:hypothetical protein